MKYTWSSISVGVLAVLAVVPFTLLAQTSDENKVRLEQEIRAALMTDERSQELSPAEFDQLVASLMGEVEAQDAVVDYVTPDVSPLQQNTFGAPGMAQEGGGVTLAEPILYGGILLLLGLAIFFLRKVISNHHKLPPPPSSPSDPSLSLQ